MQWCLVLMVWEMPFFCMVSVPVTGLNFMVVPVAAVVPEEKAPEKAKTSPVVTKRGYRCCFGHALSHSYVLVAEPNKLVPELDCPNSDVGCAAGCCVWPNKPPVLVAEPNVPKPPVFEPNAVDPEDPKRLPPDVFAAAFCVPNKPPLVPAAGCCVPNRDADVPPEENPPARITCNG